MFFLALMIISVMIFILFINLKLFNVTIEGLSMYPTFEHGDVVTFNKSKKINRNDIITFEPKSVIFNSITGEFLEDVLFVKRVVGIPGDIIKSNGETLFINDEEFFHPITNSFVHSKKHFQIKIPNKKYFVLSDNHAVSMDSRHSEIGLVDINKIHGKKYKGIV